jgi:hypothetical protein
MLGPFLYVIAEAGYKTVHGGHTGTTIVVVVAKIQGCRVTITRCRCRQRKTSAATKACLLGVLYFQ